MSAAALRLAANADLRTAETRGASISDATVLFDPQQLVVLADGVRGAQGADLDLTSRGAHGEIRNERIVGLTGPRRNDGVVAGCARRCNDLQGIGQCADLVGLDEHRVRNALTNTASKTL